MAGTSNITGQESIIFADNASFDGTERGGRMAADGQLWIGSTASPHVRRGTLTAGTGISIANGAGSITISATSTFTWVEVTGTSQAAAVNTGYILNNGSLVTLTLPSTAAVGDIVRVAGKGSGGWRVAQNAGQTIHYGNVDSTTGAGGRLDSTNRYDSIELLCTVADTDFTVLSSVGNITVT